MECNRNLGNKRSRTPAPKPGQRLINNRQKALIHVAKAQLGLDDASYREILGSFGVNSSTELTERQFETMMKHLEKIGFHKKTSPSGGRKRRPETAAQKSKNFRKPGLVEPEPLEERDRYLAAIERLLQEKNLPWNYAHKIGENMFGAAKLAWLDPEQLHKVMVALIYHKKRQKSGKE